MSISPDPTPAPARWATTSRLLESLRHFDNRTVWSDFDARYRPIIERFARRHGLSEDDAAEVAQLTLTQFARDYQRGAYDRRRGRLSSWLLSIARHRIVDAQRAAGRRAPARGHSALVDLAQPPTSTRVARDHSRQSVFDRAMFELRATTRTDEQTIQVFEAVALLGVPADEVAARFNLTVDHVYRIKNRITERLRKIVNRLESDDAQC